MHRFRELVAGLAIISESLPARPMLSLASESIIRTAVDNKLAARDLQLTCAISFWLRSGPFEISGHGRGK